MRLVQLLKLQAALIFFFAFVLLTSIPVRVILVRASSETVVKVEPYTSYANVTEAFTVNVTVVDVQNLYGVEMILYWNSSVLKVVNVDVRLGQVDGVLYGTPFIVENSTQEGKYVLAATSTPPVSSFNGSGNIVRITFNVANSGDSKLDLEAQLHDYPPPDRWPRVSLPIEHTTIGGLFVVVPEFSNVVVLIVFMISTALVVACFKRISQN